jgi:hypothetical protein
LHHHCWAFHLKVSASSYKFLHQLVQVDFIFSLFISRFRGRQIWHLAHCKEWREALHHRCWVFHLKVSTSFCIISFKWILYSTSDFWLSTSLVLLESSYKFLQVPTSICSPMAFNVSVV